MCVWAMTSASRWAAPLPPLWVEEDEVVEVVEPWMAWLIQCSMLMLPWLEVGVPCESPCTEPSSSEPDDVSVGETNSAHHGEDTPPRAHVAHGPAARQPSNTFPVNPLEKPQRVSGRAILQNHELSVQSAPNEEATDFAGLCWCHHRKQRRTP